MKIREGVGEIFIPVHQYNLYIVVHVTHILASHVVIIELWTACYFYT